jgi:CHAD domain-containing protein
MAKAKRVKGIKCNAPASVGIKLVLVTRFEELTGLHETALDWSDPEGVHSMRVASRRLRSALRDFLPYLRKRGLGSVQKKLRNVAASLGEVRDQDVAILALEKIQTDMPADFSPALKEFIDKRKELREQAREELRSTLETQLKQLQAEFIAAVDDATAMNEAKAAKSTPVTFVKMSEEIILARLKELERLSHGLFRPFEVENLHEMRIAAKRLRYAIELFQQCWGNSLASYAKRTARIQTALGEVHDCDVWIESFGKQIGEARKQKQHQDVAAFVWLLSHFMKLRTKHLRQAFARWREWEAHEVSSKLRAILHSEEPQSGTKSTN